jgi:hypothetical protein
LSFWDAFFDDLFLFLASIYARVSPSSYFKSRFHKSLHARWARRVKRVGKCYICGSTSQLQAHHLNDKTTYPHLAYRVSNGVCLCRECHMGFHSWMGGTQVSCTSDDFNAYLDFIKSSTSHDYSSGFLSAIFASWRGYFLLIYLLLLLILSAVVLMPYLGNFFSFL